MCGGGRKMRSQVQRGLSSMTLIPRSELDKIILKPLRWINGWTKHLPSMWDTAVCFPFHTSSQCWFLLTMTTNVSWPLKAQADAERALEELKCVKCLSVSYSDFEKQVINRCEKSVMEEVFTSFTGVLKFLYYLVTVLHSKSFLRKYMYYQQNCKSIFCSKIYHVSVWR